MTTSTKKDSVIYLLGALQRLAAMVNLPDKTWILIYSLLDGIHKFIEEHGK